MRIKTKTAIVAKAETGGPISSEEHRSADDPVYSQGNKKILLVSTTLVPVTMILNSGDF